MTQQNATSSILRKVTKSDEEKLKARINRLRGFSLWAIF